MKYCVHLALAEGVVQRVVDLLRLDAESRRGVAVDRQRRGGARHLLVGGDVAQDAAGCCSFASTFGAQSFSSSRFGVLQRVLELRPRQPAADADVLRRLHVELDALAAVCSFGRSRAMNCVRRRACRSPTA